MTEGMQRHEAISTNQRVKLLWRISGILAIFLGFVQLVAIALETGLFYGLTLPILLIQSIVAIAGGVLAILQIKYVAPWLILASALLYWVFKSLNLIDDFWSPLDTFTQLSRLTEFFGFGRGWLIYLKGLVPWLLIVSAIIAIIAFFMSQSESKRDKHATINAGGNMSSNNESVVAGWYADPNGLPTERYWDGSTWTDQTRPPSAPAFPLPTRGQTTTMKPRNGMGSAALTLGILGLFLGWLFSLLAIIFGGVGVGRANRGEATNRGAALWGLWLGVIGLVLWVIIVVAIFGSSV